MPKKVAIFWPGDYRARPNEWALAQSRETTDQLVAALRKLGRSPYVVEGYLTRPDEAIAKLGPIDDPMIGVFVHWTYAPHTVDGVVGKDNPLLLASNFSGTWPGLVALLNTGASLESVGRAASRVWTDAPDWTDDDRFMERLDEWCTTGRIRYETDEIRGAGAATPESVAIAGQVLDDIREAPRPGADARRHLDGHDQRLLRPAAALPDRLRRAQGQPGVADRSGEDRSPRRGSRRRSASSRTGASRFTGRKRMPGTSRRPQRASSSAATWPCSTCWRNSRPIAWAGSTSSGS